MRNRFDLQLDSLEESLKEMGMCCREAITLTIDSLMNQNEKKAKEVVSTSMRIRRMERNIESICLKLLLQQQPVARDLRVISSGLKAVYDLERIGDVTGDIAQLILKEHISIASDILNIHGMADVTGDMVNKAITALTSQNAELAEEVIRKDDEVDDLFKKAKKHLAHEYDKTDANVEYALNLLMVAKYFEKIGDHAVNIAEWAHFSATGILKENSEETF